MFGVGEESRRVLLLALAAALATAIAACKAETPPLTGANDAVAEECSPYADQLVAYTPASGGDASKGQFALGAPDENAVTVAPDDVLTIGFIGLGGVQESDVAGPDIHLVATAVDGTTVDAFMSVDGEAWETAGTAGNANPGDDLELDIADTASLSLVVYLQLVGVSGALAVDAVESLQTTCTTSVR
jgi:hypothetical protein